MTTWLLTWNPNRSESELLRAKQRLQETGSFRTTWSCGRTKRIEKGDRFYFVQQAEEPRGVVGSGTIVRSPHWGAHWDRARRPQKALYVGIEFDVVLDPTVDEILRTRDMARGPLSRVPWNTQSSGTSVPDELVPKLDKAWADHLRGRFVPPEQSHLPTRYIEGQMREVRVNVYERDPQARLACIAAHGWRCAVCRMSFREVYGDLGRDFIHVHHLHPLGGKGKGKRRKVDPVEDLRPVCPNCHAMLHRPDQLLEIEELRRVIAKERRRRGR